MFQGYFLFIQHCGKGFWPPAFHLKSEEVSGQTQKQVQMSRTGAINDYNGLFLPVLSINICSVLVLALPSVMLNPVAAALAFQPWKS